MILLVMTKIISYFNIINKIFLLNIIKTQHQTTLIRFIDGEKNIMNFHLRQIFLEILGEATASFASLWLRACAPFQDQVLF